MEHKILLIAETLYGVPLETLDKLLIHLSNDVISSGNLKIDYILKSNFQNDLPLLRETVSSIYNERLYK